MGTGRKNHLKRLAAPKSWMLAKTGGVFAVKMRGGAHTKNQSLPISVFIRYNLKYAMNAREAKQILHTRAIKVDGKVRTDHKFPLGFMDVLQIEKTGENFRILFDVKGRFAVHRITSQEAKYKLCKVRKVELGSKGVPFVYTTDGRTIRYPDPLIKMHDSIQLDIATGKIQDFLKFEVGNVCMVLGGGSTGRVGNITNITRHDGTNTIVTIKDSRGQLFSTRRAYVFIIGKGNENYISLPTGKGIKLSIEEERDIRLARKTAS